MQAVWENRKFYDRDDYSTKKIFNGVLSVSDSLGTTTYKGRWIESKVFACLKDGRTWHVEFDAEGALSGLDDAGAEDSVVLSWERTHREPWKVVD